MSFHMTDKSVKRSFSTRSRVINVYQIAREPGPSYFTSQWKLLELKRDLDARYQTMTSPALPFGL